jgi:hypothetical protein
LSIRSRIESIVIPSKEPWIPWELCRLVGEENGRIVEGEFLCERYDVARWVPGRGRRPLTPRNLAVVVPQNSGLSEAPAELAFFESLASPSLKVTRIHARYRDVLEALASGIYDGWHFTGHGADYREDPDRAELLLEDRPALTPRDLLGEAANLKLQNPIVFQNACQSSRGGFSLTGVGGWARRFMEAGAGAFIGTHWSISDRAARRFAETFYSEILLGTPIGRAVRLARAAIREPGDPTWLARTVFADPLAAPRDGGQVAAGA